MEEIYLLTNEANMEYCSEEECGYCGNFNEPDNICQKCWDKMLGEEE